MAFSHFFPEILVRANFCQYLKGNFCWKLTKYPNFQDISDFLEYLDFHFSWEFSPASNTYLFLSIAGQPHFNTHYEDLLKQLPSSMKKDVWLRLTIRKNNPLSEDQAREFVRILKSCLLERLIGTIRKKIAKSLRLMPMLLRKAQILYPD